MWKLFCCISGANQIKSHINCSGFFCFDVPLTIIFAAVLSVTTGVIGCGWPIMLGQSVWIFTFGIFQRILLIPLQWVMPWGFSWYYISHVRAHFLGALLLLVCCCWVLCRGKYIYVLCCINMVLRYIIHLNILVESFHFFYIMSLCLDVTHCNSITGCFVSMSLWLFLYVAPTGSSVPLTLLGQWILHSKGILQQSSVVFLIDCI